MLSYLWKPATTELSPQDILELTRKNFSPLATSEIEQMHSVPLALLKELDINQPDFHEQYDKIIFGTIFAALAYERDKYGSSNNPSKFMLLLSMCNVKRIIDLGYCAPRHVENDPGLRKLIVETGAIVLETKYITSWHIDQHYPAKHKPEFNLFLKQRLAKYNPQLNDELKAEAETQNRMSCTIV